MKLSALICAIMVSSTSAAVPDEFPYFEINLDLAPNMRFFEISQHFSEGIVLTLNSFLEEYYYPAMAVLFIWDKIYWILEISQPERYQELEGIVAGVNSPDLDMPRAVLLNQVYELGAWCTSIVAKQADGTIIHSRNLDYNHAADEMRNITYRAKFIQNGKYSFDAVMFAGTLGVYTGMKDGGFSIS